jgi:mono/diheme cytochrome c family protein
MTIRVVESIVTGFVVSALVAGLHGQEPPPRSVWDGIYAVDQAKAGLASYSQACSSCHGDNLEGGGPSPALVGSDFLTSWYGSSVGDLFERIRVSMPADRPGSISNEKNAAILAYLLQVNGFPSGSQELPSDIAALKKIRIVAKPER